MNKCGAVRMMLAGIVVFSLVIFLSACGSGGGGGGPGATGSVTLTSDVSSIPANGSSSAILTATVFNNEGKPAASGTAVSFSTDRGHFKGGGTSISVRTLDSGIATAALISGTTPGVAKVTANANGVTQSIYITFTGGAGSITLTAQPEEIWADGKSSSAIQAIVKDALGNPVTPGTEVTFTTDLGRFRNDQQTLTVTTLDSTGIVTTSLMSATETGRALVSVSSGDVTQSVYVEFIEKGGDPFAIELEADPEEITADGKSSSKITATVTDSKGNPVKPGTSITFSTDLGSFGKDQKGEDKKIYTVTTPDSTGVVTISLIAGTAAGSATVTATANGVTQSIAVTFIGGVVASIEVTADPDTLIADGESTSQIRAHVTDAKGNPVADGEKISFTITAGTGTLSATSATTVSGYAAVTYTASKTTGSVTIQAMAVNNVFDTVTIELTGGGVGSIDLGASPKSIPADGFSSSTITATVKNSAGKPVVKGTVVSFSTTLGTLSSTSVSTPDSTGVVTISLSAGTTAGSATVTATVNGVTQSVVVIFTGGEAANITVTADPDTLIADGESTSQIRAHVTDAKGNPVADGGKISFTITAGTGTLSATSATTVGGYAAVTYTASKTTGSVTIQAMAVNNVFDTVTITLTDSTEKPIDMKISGGSRPFSSFVVPKAGMGVSLTASPTLIPADGSSSSIVTATIKDPSGSQVAKGASLTFTTTLGRFLDGSVAYSLTTSDDSGMVTVPLIAGTTAGTATVVCSSSGATQATTITFVGRGKPASLSLATSRTSIKSDNSNNAVITATILDGNHIPVGNCIVEFSASTGRISTPSATTDATGRAKITFSAGSVSTNRTATIEAAATGPDGPITASIPVAISGSTLTLTPNKAVVLDDGSTPAALKAAAKDGRGNPIAGVPISFKVSGTGGATVTPASGITDASGILETMVRGVSQGAVTVMADWDGTPASQEYNVIAAADSFAIVLPADRLFAAKTRPTASLATTADNVTIAFNDNGVAADTITSADAFGAYLPGDRIMVGGSLYNDGVYTISGAVPPTSDTLTLVPTDSLTNEAAGNPVTITNGALVGVRAPDPIANVAFTTTIGGWDRGTSPIVTKAVPVSKYVWAVLSSNLAGPAMVQICDAADPSISDKMTIAFSNPSGSAGRLALKPSVRMAAPSIGGIKNTATLTATVRTGVADGNQVVSGVPVVFSIVNPTGGGEYVEPTVQITDSAGQARATFTSGSLSSCAQGVTINAYVLDDPPTITDSVAIVIGGTAGSVIIGRGTAIYDVDDATYRLPMSVLVTDANGNAVSGAVVKLSAWPHQYRPGVWYNTVAPPDKKYEVYYTGAFDNEDENKNLTLDPGEDKDGDGKLTPANSSAGGVPAPSEVITGANGVASFDLIYLKAYAGWIKTRIRASTLVLGTETTSSVEMVLPVEVEQARSGLLPDSPFPIGLVTSPTVNAEYTFSPFRGTEDAFTTSSNLSAGSSSMGVASDNCGYTYNPADGVHAAQGNVVWDYIRVTNGGLGAYFPVRIIIK